MLTLLPPLLPAPSPNIGIVSGKRMKKGGKGKEGKGEGRGIGIGGSERGRREKAR